MKKEKYTDPVAEVDIFPADEVLCSTSNTTILDPSNVGGSDNGEVGFNSVL